MAKTENKEIEKKWVILELENMEKETTAASVDKNWLNQVEEIMEKITKSFGKYKRYYMEQYYTKISENEEERYRMKETNEGTVYYHTIKRGNGLTREEIEEEITEEEYRKNIERKIGNSIKKTRFKFENGIEVDVYTSHYLVIAEKEFKSEEEAHKYELPIKAKDVTSDKRYKNKNLALNL